MKPITGVRRRHAHCPAPAAGVQSFHPSHSPAPVTKQTTWKCHIIHMMSIVTIQTWHMPQQTPDICMSQYTHDVTCYNTHMIHYVTWYNTHMIHYVTCYNTHMPHYTHVTIQTCHNIHMTHETFYTCCHMLHNTHEETCHNINMTHVTFYHLTHDVTCYKILMM